jgi:hypothetical protein
MQITLLILLAYFLFNVSFIDSLPHDSNDSLNDPEIPVDSLEDNPTDFPQMSGDLSGNV